MAAGVGDPLNHQTQEIIMSQTNTQRRAYTSLRILALALVFAALGVVTPTLAGAATLAPVSAVALSAPVPATMAAGGEEAASLESAATKAGETGRKIAMSLIGLGFAIASIVLAFRRDFKEAAGIFAVGFVAVLLASKTGVTVLQDTVTTLFGSSS
jgi:hypothetical protein